MPPYESMKKQVDMILLKKFGKRKRRFSVTELEDSERIANYNYFINTTYVANPKLQRKYNQGKEFVEKYLTDEQAYFPSPRLVHVPTEIKNMEVVEAIIVTLHEI